MRASPSRYWTTRRCARIAVFLVTAIVLQFVPVQVSASPSAGLMIGPIDVGPYRFKVTNPHRGYVGPRFGPTRKTHVNVHFERENPRWPGNYNDIVNYHVVVHREGGPLCLYVWESVHDRVVVDTCLPDVMDGLRSVGHSLVVYVKQFLSSDDLRLLAELALVGFVVGVLIKAVKLLPVFAVFGLAFAVSPALNTSP